MNSNWAEPAHFLNYLYETLIPDLRESGKEATADDFEDAAEFITLMGMEIALLKGEPT